MNLSDLLLTIGNIIIMTSIFHQMYKNYKGKNTRTQSIYWQIQSLIGYFMFLSGYWYLDMFIPFIGVVISVIIKSTLLFQITWYNRKSNLLENWMG